MRLFCLVFLLLLPGIVFSESPKKLTITGATWGSPSGEKNNPVKTHIIETDESGRIVKIVDTNRPSSIMVITQEEGRIDTTFIGNTNVKIDLTMSWSAQQDGTTLFMYKQQNDVPESIVLGQKYPRKILEKSYSIILNTPNASDYIWKEKREKSWLEEDGRSQYQCIPGKHVVWDQYDKNGNLMYKTILEGHSSDASPETTAKMFYSKTKNSVVGNYYWTYEPSAWDESTWKKGGRIEYSGDSLSTNNPVINVVNYYILKLWFSSNAWHYFGPTLFDIPVR